MVIWVFNSSDKPKSEIQRAIRIINKQIARDFAPIWGLSARVLLHRPGVKMRVPVDGRVAHVHLASEGTANYHQDELSGIPVGHVRTDISELSKVYMPWNTWTVAFSHEVLELIADPFLNLFAKGPHPTNKARQVFYYREVCDPIQGTIYDIDGITVSNFVLPHYYNANGPKNGNDFMHLTGRLHGKRLDPFGWIESGYVGFWDPADTDGSHYTVFPQYDASHPAAKVLKAKGKFARLKRYALPHRKLAARPRRKRN